MRFRTALLGLSLFVGSCEWSGALDTSVSPPSAVFERHFGYVALPIGGPGLANISPTGESVLMWQSVLGTWGFAFSCSDLDGAFDAGLTSATAYWQTLQNANYNRQVRTDGVVDKQVWDALFYDHMEVTAPGIYDQYYNSIPLTAAQVVVARGVWDDDPLVNPPDDRLTWYWSTQAYYPVGSAVQASTFEGYGAMTNTGPVRSSKVGCGVHP